MTAEKKIYELHHEHQKWLNDLSFYKDEVAILQGRIEEVATKNTSKEFLAMVDHYLNQFLIQREQINHLKHEIKGHESVLQESIHHNSTAVDHRTMPDEVEQREKMVRFEEIFTELRSDVNHFLSKVL